MEAEEPGVRLRRKRFEGRPRAGPVAGKLRRLGGEEECQGFAAEEGP
jgi:hypothetical protein